MKDLKSYGNTPNSSADQSCVRAPPASAALSADSTEKSSPFDQDNLFAQRWSSISCEIIQTFVLPISPIWEKWTKTSTVHFIVCINHTSQFLNYNCSPCVLMIYDICWLTDTSTILMSLLRLSMRTPLTSTPWQTTCTETWWLIARTSVSSSGNDDLSFLAA